MFKEEKRYKRIMIMMMLFLFLLLFFFVDKHNFVNKYIKKEWGELSRRIDFKDLLLVLVPILSNQVTKDQIEYHFLPNKGFSQSNHNKYKIMKILDTIGIDISKLNFDVRIHSTQFYQQFENSNKGFETMLKWVYKNSSFSKENILFIFEHTGLYSHQLSVYLTDKEIPFSLIPGLEIKRSLGIARGKNDKVDATKIALYAYRLRDEIELTVLPTEQIQSLKTLLSLRDRIVKQRAGYITSLNEQKRVLVKNKNEVLINTQKKIIKHLSKQIKVLEIEIQEIISSDEQLSSQFKLITGIKGIGPQTALFVIAYTHGFTRFKTWRKFASYCGIAPFPNASGTSIRGRTKVSNLANKKIKSLFDLCAKSAIQHSPEMKMYYTRRLEEGKNKMSTINIIRNKLLSRIFAVVERQTPYIDIMKYAA
jgi:transposase